jgi:hypothetical protein
MAFHMSVTIETHVVNDSDNSDSSTMTNLSYEDLAPIIQNFQKIDIKEIKPTIKNSINEKICEEDLSVIIDKFVNIVCLNNLNEGTVRSKSKFRKSSLPNNSFYFMLFYTYKIFTNLF